MYHFELGFYYLGYKYNLVRLGELKPNDVVLEYWLDRNVFTKRRTFKIERVEQKVNKVALVQRTTTHLHWERIQFFIPISIEGSVKRVAEHSKNVKYYAYRWDGTDNIFARF